MTENDEKYEGPLIVLRIHGQAVQAGVRVNGNWVNFYAPKNWVKELLEGKRDKIVKRSKP